VCRRMSKPVETFCRKFDEKLNGDTELREASVRLEFAVLDPVTSNLNAGLKEMKKLDF
jgi:hypothetical protein